MSEQPNLLFVFADQWRQQAFGYTGDPNARTPNIDRLAGDSINCTGAVSGCPVCTPYRASLMTGVYPHRHHLMVNDQCLVQRYPGPFLGECLREGGYQTAYIGKWHLDGHGRKACVPPDRRLGFDAWKGFECCHDYRQSHSASNFRPTCLRPRPLRRARSWPATMPTAPRSTPRWGASWRRWPRLDSTRTRSWSSPLTMATCSARRACSASRNRGPSRSGFRCSCGFPAWRRAGNRRRSTLPI
ncbi:MAG: sulfatase-like hydrolase/transferase [Lentisphaerae bacterium]|nr:sulfatase-like hydrolase/transferase [Lentisphaerota bacterium]